MMNEAIFLDGGVIRARAARSPAGAFAPVRAESRTGIDLR